MSDDVQDEQESLFEIDPDWKEQWQGMPDYSHQDLMPDSTLLVHFKTRQDRDAFAALVGQRLHERTKFIWHPKATIGTAADKVFRSSDPSKTTPRYPIYIISKGRWDSRLTAKAFEWAKVPYSIVVEPQEYDAYAAVIDPKKILVTPFSNLGQGGIPARNFVWEHSVSIGAARHWIFDDNVSGFCRFQDNLKVEVDSGALHCAIEDWVDRYENVAMAAFNYDYFAPRKQGGKIRPITLNTRCYSGILLRNDLVDKDGTPVRWRGRYNEDTDLSLRILKDGHCTVLFNAFLMYKKPTLTMKGGNTDELYAGAEAMTAEWEAHAGGCRECKRCIDGYDSKTLPCDEGRTILSKDGRWLMAESLREQHPDCTTIERKWRRWQHQVDYRAFQLGMNVLKFKEGVVIPETSPYELTLDAMPADEPSARGSRGHGTPLERRREPRAEAPRTEAPAEQVSRPSVLDFLKLAQQQVVQPVPPAEESSLEKSSQTEEQPVLASPGQPASLVEPEIDSRPGAWSLRDALLANGHRLLTRDGKFFVSDAGTLTDEERRQIKEHRDALIALAEQWTENQPSALPVDPKGDGALRSDVSRAGGEEPETGSGQEAQSLFEARPAQTLAQFLGTQQPTANLNDYVPDEPPDLSGIDHVILNFATTGLDWMKGDRPVGVTISTLDGQLCRFLPFAFQYGGNLDEATVKRWAERELRDKKITNAKTKFDVHHARAWGVDLEEQGCTFSDIQHTAALLDDRRKRFALDVLCADYFPGEPFVGRVDESRHAEHHASEVAERELFTARLVGRLHAKMYPELAAQDLGRVQDLEDGVIPAVVEMEKNGSPIDVALLEQYGRECSQRHGELLREISQECGFAFEHTASGWKRLIESLNLTVPDSFSEGVMNEVVLPLVLKGQRASQYASLNSKIFKAYPEHIVDGVLRYNINQLASDDGGTVSGRFSIGIVQQTPNEYNHSAIFGDELVPRRLFIPGSGDYLEADAAQIEFRLLVHYSENADLLQAYRDDPWMSFHKKMQEKLVAYKPDMNYAHTKSYNFAAQYGARSIKLAIMMGFITERVGDEIRMAKRWDDPRLKTIKEIEAAYAQAHPEAGALLDRASHLMKNECDKYCRRGDALHRQFPHRGYIKTFLGRRSRCVNNYKPYIALNRCLQGTGASVMKRKLTELHAVRKETGFVMRITNHDAVLGDATTPETRDKVATILNQQSFPFKVPILWQCGTGQNWAEAK